MVEPAEAFSCHHQLQRDAKVKDRCGGLYGKPSKQLEVSFNCYVLSSKSEIEDLRGVYSRESDAVMIFACLFACC